MDVRLPNLGEGADSGVVVNLLVKEGETIAKDQPLLELENEKAVATIPSPTGGTVVRIFVKPGDKVSVGQRLLAVGGEAPAAAPPPAAPTPAPAPAAPPSSPEPPAPAPDLPPLPGGSPAASPSLRALAQELGLDLAKVAGTARGGRIVMADLRAYIQRLERLAAQAGAASKATPAKAPAEVIDFSKWGPVTIKPLSSLRQVISRRMAESWNTVPRVTQLDSADVSELLTWRKQHAPAFEEKGVRLTLTVLLIKLLTAVLRRHPLFNSSLDATGENLVLKAYCHLGIAVDTEAGLIVPVLRDADKKTLAEIGRELEALALKARERKLSPDDLRGGSFTLSNQGGIGGGHFTPIVNPPQVAILGLGRSRLQPVWREGGVQPRAVLPLALSYDHRVIDGGEAARFIVELVASLEQVNEPALLA